MRLVWGKIDTQTDSFPSKVLKDRCGYGWQKRDPITVSGMTIFDSSIGVPERWWEMPSFSDLNLNFNQFCRHQYWWKDYWYNGMFPPDYMFDPLGNYGYFTVYGRGFFRDGL